MDQADGPLRVPGPWTMVHGSCGPRLIFEHEFDQGSKQNFWNLEWTKMWSVFIISGMGSLCFTLVYFFFNSILFEYNGFVLVWRRIQHILEEQK